MRDKTRQPGDNDTFDDEWLGFSDDDSGKANTKPDDRKESLKANNGKMKEATRGKQESKGKDEKHSTIDPGLSFSVLAEEEEEQADNNDGVDVSSWDSLGLHPAIMTSISKLKFSTPTPIQKACIPNVLEGHDVVGKASTGSGKTLAFAIPILERYLEQRSASSRKKKSPIALILSPTRELARQLSKHIGDLVNHAPGVDARIALLTGGLAIQKQERLLAAADIVVGTPGRVWEILSSGHGIISSMRQIRFLVVDEADRLLSEGHFNEVGEILASLDRVEKGDFPDENLGIVESEDNDDADPAGWRQTLVFSATFQRDLQRKLAGKGRWIGDDLMGKHESMEYLLRKLNFREEKPKFIDVNPTSQMAERLKEGIVECAPMEKVRALSSLVIRFLY